MTRHVLSRLAWSLLVLWLAVTATFAVLYAIPADPARALVGPHADSATVERVRHELCLDRGFAVAYGCHVARLARGELGTSFRLARPVSGILAERIGPTVELALAAALLQLLLGVPLGVLAAVRRNRGADVAASAFAALSGNFPTFFLGPLLAYLLGYQLGLFPISGHGRPGLDRLWHLFLPAMTLALAGMGAYARLVRSELAEALEQDYVRTARAKGASPAVTVLRHALRNVLLPVMTLAGVDLATLLGGAVVVETVFAWPGLGREAVMAILNVDLPVMIGIVLVSTAAVLMVTVLVDIAAAAADPRVARGG